MPTSLNEPLNLSEKLSKLLVPVADLDEGLLVSAVYDGDKKLAVLKFYDPKLDRVWRWEDNTGHRPYCYTRLPMSDLNSLRSRGDVVAIEDVSRLDLLSDSTVTVRKIVATDPLAIGGGAPGKSIRDEIRAWEADIKYYENYVYDRSLRVGTYYRIRGGQISPLEKEIPELVAHSLNQILAKNTGEQTRFIREWAELLSQPLCSFKRIALDIEVANEEARIPDPEKAERAVIAISFHNDQESLVYLVAKEGDASLEGAKTAYTPTVFPDEASMIRAAFAKIMDYPFLITFNGDDFDLRYLVHRAERLGINGDEIPISLMRQEASLRHGVHIDLYRFFSNRSIQVYVYSNKYSEHTLNGISEAVLNKSKIEFEGNVADLPLLELANYCLNDSQLTYELTSLNSSLMMKILLVIARIAKMPMNDVARLGVSNWIRSMLFYEHRRMGAIIPRQDELAQKGGASSEAIIKGKKYKGGLVIEPTPGVHFGVSVLDFASLYPSIIKVHNLSYETVNCPHEECRSNRVPDTDHWVCTKRSGIESLVTGSLRDLRVGHYKHLAKDKSLSQDERELYGVVSQGLKVILNACFTPDTFVVTPHGIKNIRDMKVGDKVVNVNPETLATEIDTVVEVQQFPYKGELYHFNDRRFVDLAVTPNHRMLVGDKSRQSKLRAAFLTAEEVFKWTNMSIPKLEDGIKDLAAPERVSLLGTAKELDALANIYPRVGARLSTWFGGLPQEIKEKIREFGSVNKNRSKLDQSLRSHYVLPASRVTEHDVDAIEQARGFVLLGTQRYSKIPARYDAETFASLCGWFVSEGNLIATEPKYYASGGHRGRSSGIVITQSYGKGNSMGVPYRAEIKRAIGQLGLRPRSDSRDKKYYRVSNNILHHWMLKNCYSGETQERRSRSKRVPEFVFGSRRLIQSFFSSCYKGDGSSRNKQYSTTSLQLAQEMVVLQSLLGAKTKLVYDQRDRIYRVIFRNVSSKLTYAGDFKHKYVRKIPYEGAVYCLTTERNHTVLAGRNGRFVPVGQSYGVMGFETFALYCLPVAEATAAYGRYAITRTIDKCKHEGISVIYSDTDSLFVENPDKSKIEELTRWAEHDLGVELDIDKTYRYVAFSERKKNYFGVLADGTADIKGLTGKKSISGDTSILARIDGDATFTNVQDVYERFSTSHKVELPTISDEMRTGWAEVNEATKHTVNDIFVLRTSKGRVLKLSGDHSVFFVDQFGRLYCKETRSVKVGEVLVGAKYIPVTGTCSSLDLSAYLPDTIDRDGILYSSKAHATTGQPVPRSLPVTPDLGFLFGIYTAEGSTAAVAGSRSSGIDQSEDLNPEVCKALKAAWFQTFNWELKQHRSSDRRTFYLPMLHARLFKELCGGDSGTKHVPAFIFNSGLEVVRRYLVGLFSGDGYSDGGRTNIASKSPRLLEQVAYLLTYFDIDSRIRRMYNSKYKLWYYQLSILGASSRRRFHDEIGFLQPRFQRVPAVGPMNKELLPISTAGLIQVKTSILKRLGLTRFRQISIHDSRHFNLGLLEQYNGVIDALAKYSDTYELALLSSIRTMLNNQDATYDEVTSIERVPGSCLMYDFSVPNSERFIAGNIPSLLHNSQTPEFLKKAFYDCLAILGTVYAPEDFERARRETKALLTKMVSRLRNKEIPLDELSFNVMIGKAISGYSGTTPQHVRAAQLLQNNGRQIKAGDIISFVKTKTPPNVKPVS
ncbi:MAG: DNA polymerase domain-containing protein, partial [Nitrososphaerales archaeon]